MDAYFVSSVLGSQVDLLVSPECFQRFVLPGIRRLAAQARRHGLPVVMHSGGSIARVIPELLAAGVEVLHPIQAKARGMDAATLSSRYPGLVCMGGVDAQELLPFGTPEQVEQKTRELQALFGTRLILSPSHEKILPNIPPENIEAIARGVGAAG